MTYPLPSIRLALATLPRPFLGQSSIRLSVGMAIFARRGQTVYGVAVTALRKHVPSVVARRPQEKVRRIAAGPIVTVMADLRIGGYGAISSNPCSAVGEDFIIARGPRHFAVTVPHPMPLPFPALVRSPLLHESVKASGQRFSPARYPGVPLRHNSAYPCGASQFPSRKRVA